MSTPSTQTSSSSRTHRYDASLADRIEHRWQSYWDEHATFTTPNPGDATFDASRPKYFCMDMFPYPSGAGLHVGHPEGYTATDIICRYKRMTGHNVLHPMGWDAFGLPAEQYAIQTGVHPALTTRKAIDNFRRQLKRFGFSYDWSREFGTIDEDYYRWTQWIWLKAFNAWYDRDANRARPVAELIAGFRSGARPVGYDAERPAGIDLPDNADEETFDAWDALDGPTQMRILSTYRIAYLSHQTVNWCPALGTALANEEVIDGRSERGGHPVFRKPLRQWMFRITAFADRLLADLDSVDWPESTRTMQREWIGRSEGAEINFPLQGITQPALCVYTTRPDTIFGATYMVVAPEHGLVEQLLAHPTDITDVDALRAYVETSRNRSDVDRMAESKEKTGVFTGVYAMNPATNTPIPVWTADYVLMGYGTGAIMAVPAQDQRDWDFAKAFDLDIVRTVTPPDDFDGEAFTGDGPAMNSAFLDGKGVVEAKAACIDWLESERLGRRKVNFKLRDWLFSRQRYWGEPFPVVHTEDGTVYPVEPVVLPVVLPDLEDYTPAESDDPQPLLAKATDWMNTTAGEAGVSSDLLPAGTPVRRETNTMPGWAGSCWYYLRYCSPKDGERFVTRDVERYWMGADGSDSKPGVDLYIGGAEHAVLHLLYARFWHKILFDLGEVSTPEPFVTLFHQGLITSHAYQRADGSLVAVDAVEERGDTMIEIATGDTVTQVVAKMSKSLKNVVNPDDVIAEYGADTFRLYEMYMGPLDASKPWQTRDMIGLFRFLQRAWRLCIDEDTGEVTFAAEANADVEKALHRTVDKVARDIERLAFNTGIAALIEFVNTATTHGVTRDQMERFALTLAPFAPHIGEELWSKLGHDGSLTYAAWPSVDPAMLVDDEVEMPVQVMGKVRGRITVAADADEDAIKKAAMADEAIAAHLEGKTIRKVIVVQGKIINIVAT